MPSRRQFLELALAAWLMPEVAWAAVPPVWVNDVHSQLNPTLVRRIVAVRTVDEARQVVASERALAIAGGRHAGGGQQFLSGSTLLDMSAMNRPLALDEARGILTVEAGIQWPAVIRYLVDRPHPAWMIRQKQGVHAISVGGTLGANAHGNTLGMGPFVDDVEWFELVDPSGTVRRCSRSENSEWFKLATGGYGLFGVVTRVALRLQKRRKLRAIVDMAAAADFIPLLERRRTEGCLYGSAQTTIDPTAADYLQRGVVTCYLPVDDGTPIEANALDISDQGWLDLITLAHVQPGQAFARYAAAYQATAGKVYHVEDVLMSGAYLPNYHLEIDTRLRSRAAGTEMLVEVYVPRPALATLLGEMAADFRKHAVQLVFASIRVVERDTESFLAWARQPWACAVLNLHVEHTADGLEAAAEAVRRLIDMARGHGGAYYLTYGRFATRAQVEACFPQMRAFLAAKRRLDPSERLQSDWYRYYRALLET